MESYGTTKLAVIADMFGLEGLKNEDLDSLICLSKINLVFELISYQLPTNNNIKFFPHKPDE